MILTKTTDELIEVIAAIPSTVTSIKFNHNALFRRKTHLERDKLIEGLKSRNILDRLDLNDNGENEITRAAAPLISLKRQSPPNLDLPKEIINKMAFYLGASTQPFSNLLILNEDLKSITLYK